MADALSNFGISLLMGLLPNTDANVFVSPLSIVGALGMALAGSTPDSAVQRELLQAIGVADEKTVLEGIVGPTTQHALTPPEGSEEGEETVEVRIANSVWVRDGIKPEFVAAVQHAFAAHAVGHIAEAEINAWVEGVTKGKIKNLLNGVPEDCTAVLVNAIYFKGLWREPFDPKKTEAGPFRLEGGKSKDVQMMFLKDKRRRYADFGPVFGAGAAALALPYRGDEHSCILILPPEGATLAEFVGALGGPSGGGLPAVVAKLSSTSVEVEIPRMKVEFEGDLLPILGQRFGLNRALKPSNEWGRLSDQPMSIGGVIHKAVVELDEQGTVAAAATAVMMLLGCAMGAKVLRFVVNRPFLLVLWDEKLRVPMFVGGIRDPDGAAAAKG